MRPSLGSGPGRGWEQERPPTTQPGERREGTLGATVRPPARGNLVWAALGSHGPLDGACPAWASSRCWRWGKQVPGSGDNAPQDHHCPVLVCLWPSSGSTPNPEEGFRGTSATSALGEAFLALPHSVIL